MPETKKTFCRFCHVFTMTRDSNVLCAVDEPSDSWRPTPPSASFLPDLQVSVTEGCDAALAGMSTAEPHDSCTSCTVKT